MIFHLEQRHIDRGAWNNCYWCPAALCIKETTGGKQVYVTGRYIEMGGRRLSTPEPLRSWIIAFDKGGASAISPITFELPYP